jgi:cytochrome c5
MNRIVQAFLTVIVTLMAGPLIATPSVADDRYVLSSDEKISQGRDLWIQNCESCHGYGVADAPVPMNPEEWSFRLFKGKQVLYEHAINGFMGPDYSMMPARGGNEELNDEEVKLAVDYMIFLASYYIDKHITNAEVNNDSTTN